MNLQKKYYVYILVTISFIVLGGCSTLQSSLKENNESSTEILSSDNGFVNVLNDYMTAQQDLMLFHSDTDSQGFEDLSKHAKNVISSDEYETWVSESKNLANYNVDKLTNKTKYTELKDAISTYDKIQMEYFTQLAEAQTLNEYNEVNVKLSTDLSNAQDTLFNVYYSLSE